MLTIKNFDRLRGQRMGDWEVRESIASSPKSWLKAYHYSLTLDRDGYGAAILIDRNINPLLKQYHVYVCCATFDNKIYEGAFSKQVIMDKGHFLKHMMGYIKAEYEMMRQSNP
jgi:hypothetical protein